MSTTQTLKFLGYTVKRSSNHNRIILGKGSLGEVYLGENDEGKKVAMKSVQLNKIEKAKEEIFMSKYIGCGHKNVACLLDVIENEKFLFIITEYIGDKTLEQIIHITPIEDFLDIAHQIADGLEYIHNLNVAHRDIKPANIVMKNHTPVIIDFDFACISGNDEHDCTGKKGTPKYLPPEMWINMEGRDPLAGDIYSLGITFYYMFNGLFPFPIGERMDLWDVKDLVIETEPLQSDTNIPKLDELIMSMISRNQEDRPKINRVKSVLADLIKSL